MITLELVKTILALIRIINRDGLNESPVFDVLSTWFEGLVDVSLGSFLSSVLLSVNLVKIVRNSKDCLWFFVINIELDALQQIKGISQHIMYILGFIERNKI